MPPTKKPSASSKRKATPAKSDEPTAKKQKIAATPVADTAPTGNCKEAVASLTAALKDAAWKKALEEEFSKPYFEKIAQFVAEERKKGAVHPPADKVFEALNVTPLDKVKVVILGQDPYHEPGQAHGLSFSVLPGVKPPPSLKNMYKELATDIPGFITPDHGHLLEWAKQGVLLLNATLTVREGHTEANSHAKCGWQQFTDELIKVINSHCENVVFLLWGGFAQKKGKIVDTSRHKVLECAHPSPLSFKKWQGCKAFSKCNEALRALGHTEVKWQLPQGPQRQLSFKAAS